MTEAAGVDRFQDAVTRTVDVEGVSIAYREIGPADGIPLVALTHLGANLDNWDPRIVDALATGRRVILLGYQGVGRSGGTVRASIQEMADDAIGAIRALGHSRIDLFGLSMGGMVAQEIAHRAPDLISRMILASSGPAGGPGLTAMTRVMIAGTLGAVTTFQDPKMLLFFARTQAGRTAGREYLKRLGERSTDRDTAVHSGVLRAQLAAVNRWGNQPPAAASLFTGPVLLVHGDSDRMVTVANSNALADVFPESSLTVYPRAGHGAVFQYHDEFTASARDFLRR
ncbi:Pimeloyl-ACP methyl ester carboxylesterase [Arthrobacter alpinus]|uniref:Pimeloyl-ACP methyl ester carboxylesterase n=1 Tax=Arthrobacter alpinus TaxID=656366 RepID=A0A1H5FWQ3_9MICC|nr:alpha/beta hydrolase [Arthrobacter alpinus]SEE07863.1 Pimeloyl-ACP methyl ester carboxylesterase [Arthrobacter alpinus]